MKKTYKREISVAMLVWLVYIVETKDVSIIEVLVWPIFSFVTAAFGFDVYSKLQQGNPTKPSNGGWTQRSGQRPSWQDQQPDGGDYQHYGAEDK